MSKVLFLGLVLMMVMGCVEPMPSYVTPPDASQDAGGADAGDAGGADAGDAGDAGGADAGDSE